MVEIILHGISSLDGLLERLPPKPHLRGEEFERAAKSLLAAFRCFIRISAPWTLYIPLCTDTTYSMTTRPLSIKR